MSRRITSAVLITDGNPNMNLASFVHTWVPDESQKLMEENLNKVRLISS